jgi:hypothetical protein
MATTKHTGDVGEHWVLYRLIRAGYTAVLAPTNAKAVDILATDRDGKPFSIQVKTKANPKSWRLMESAERMADDRLFYCFVDLGRSGDLEPPEVYVVPSAVVAKTVREGHARWLRGTNRKGEPHKDNPIRHIVLEPWLEAYRENWSLIAGAPAPDS